MTQTAQTITSAPIGTIWSGKSGNTTYFLRKTGQGGLEVWNSDYSNEHYPVSLSQAVTYANQYNMKATNLPSSSSPKPAPVPKPAPQTKQLVGAADGDSGNKQSTTNTQTSRTTPNVSSSTTPGSNKISSGDPNKPGRRVNNPLGYLASYTYQASLYMITPDAYAAFVQSGRKNINIFSQATAGQNAGGAFLIAQSAGMGSPANRAPGFDLDMYIDNITITSQVSGHETQSATNISEFTFQIIEPYGFSFLSRLRNAADILAQYSASLRQDAPKNASKQFFILGIRFFGWDINGKPVTGSDVYDGRPLDSTTSGTALFERYYDISINSIKFKIDGKQTTYSCAATRSAEMAGFGQKYGIISKDMPITSSTVGEAINNMLKSLTEEEEKSAKNRNATVQGNTYKAIIVPEIANASIITKAELNKYRWPGSGAKDTTQVNDSTAIKNQKPNDTSKTIQIKNGTPILDGINSVVIQSKFMEDALVAVKTDAVEPDPKAKQTPVVKPDTKKNVQWYNCTPRIDAARWDSTKQDWSYDITYVINVYETPVVTTSGVNPGKKFYGPHKKYEYYYTGKNTEVIDFVIEINNGYFNVVTSSGLPAGANGTGAGSVQPSNGSPVGAPQSTAQVSNQRPAQPRLGRLGEGLDAQNNYVNSLYDPSAQATAKLTVLGDPDFLMSNPPVSETQVYNQYYGEDGFTVNPNGGQVFIDFDLKEAVDYSSSGNSQANANSGAIGQPGTLSLNESIKFWNYTPDISALITGLLLQVITVKSTLSNGAFKQQIECTLPADFGAINPSSNDANGGREPAQNTTRTGPAPSNNQATTTAPAQKSDPKYSSSGKGNSSVPNKKPVSIPVQSSTLKPLQPASNKTGASGIVADDDAVN